VNGQFRRCALELQQNFPGIQIEGGPYTPPVSVQYGIKAVRASQAMVGVFFFFGEQILAAAGRQPFDFMKEEMHTKIMYHLGALYGLNVIADMLKSINAFEVIYNGKVIHSKLESGSFPEPGTVSQKLKQAQKQDQNS